jgi:hypothetical protein
VLDGSENWTFIARDARRITATEIPGKTIEDNSGCVRME